LANTKQEPWKLPLPEYIEELYFKHFKKSLPDRVHSIEQMVRDYRRKNRSKKYGESKKKTQIHAVSEKNGNSSGAVLSLQGVALSRLSVLLDPHPPDSRQNG
jgi:hypothetical protein